MQPSAARTVTPEYVINGAVYVTPVDEFRATREITHGQTTLHEMTEINSADIDTRLNLWLVR